MRRLASRSASPAGVRAAYIAGATPNTTPVSIASTTANDTARQSSAMSLFDWNAGGPNRTRIATSPRASGSPVTAPMSASATLSVASCRTIRSRVAPRAVRSATSRARAAPRASNRFATFAQAMSSTNATAADPITSSGRTSLAISSRSGMTRAPQPAFVTGKSTALRAASEARADCARSTDTPRRSRPNT
jgi:hypothetical protein